ncbi:50S ribosomal protein L31 [Patescibacteria group bacterium]|nr:50S ribosomal protein L31 [Patescibacteria group bacterium]
MQQGIHPDWHDDCQVKCACGNAFTIGSTVQTLDIDICNQCHPFFSGEMKFVDRQGRVDKFKHKMEFAKKQLSKKQKTKSAKPSEPAKSYRQILRDSQSSLRTSKQAPVTPPSVKVKSQS